MTILSHPRWGHRAGQRVAVQRLSTLGHGLMTGALLLGTLSLGSCMHETRSTPISPVEVRERGDLQSAPANVFSLRIIEATVPELNRGGMQWDDDRLPDVYVKVFRDGQQLFESETIRNTLNPRWDAVLPRNVLVDRDAHFRFEVWDRDPFSSDPIGVAQTLGRSTGEMRFNLEQGATLTIALADPVPHRGLGLTRYEVHSGYILVVEVEPFSPAGRAQLVPGDQIISIGGQTVQELGELRTQSAIALASDRQSPLRVRKSDGQVADVALDRGFVWLRM